jgi:hypothetical protein
LVVVPNFWERPREIKKHIAKERGVWYNCRKQRSTSPETGKSSPDLGSGADAKEKFSAATSRPGRRIFRFTAGSAMSQPSWTSLARRMPI